MYESGAKEHGAIEQDAPEGAGVFFLCLYIVLHVACFLGLGGVYRMDKKDKVIVAMQLPRVLPFIIFLPLLFATVNALTPFQI